MYDSCSPRQFGPIFNENSTSKLIPTKLTLFHIYACIIFIMYMGGHKDKRRGHGGRVVTLSPPTSEAGVRSPARPQVGKLVVAWSWSAVYSTEPQWTVCTGFLCPSNYPSWYDLYSVESDVTPQINKKTKINGHKDKQSSEIMTQ